MDKIKNNQGFTLVDMMFTIAIIGLLASISVPKFSRMMAKARTTEAKISLSALYMAEQSFLMDWNAYTVDLKNVGFQQTGERLRYVIGFVTLGQPLKVCSNYPAFGAPPEKAPTGGDSTTSFNLSDSANIKLNNFWGADGSVMYDVTYTMFLDPAPDAKCESAPGAQYFKAYAYGNPNPTGKVGPFGMAISKNMPTEAWAIDSTKKISLECRSIYTYD